MNWQSKKTANTLKRAISGTEPDWDCKGVGRRALRADIGRAAI
jgi:hypothetical protein